MSAPKNRAYACRKCARTVKNARGRCATCDPARIKAWRESHRDENIARSRARYAAADKSDERAKRKAWKDANKAKVADLRREQHTGWLPGAFAEAWLAQSGRCAICRVEMDQKGRGPRSVAADHCHITMKPRGLLCSNCNRGIGMLGDDPERARAAAAYLEAHR